MAKMSQSAGRKRAAARRPAKSKPRKRKSLAELNAWLKANHGVLLNKAQRNCIRLTGKSTFGADTRRKSA
jgi:hypothetical protein